MACLDTGTRLSQLLDELYALKEQIYYLSYPMKIYYISQPSEEPPDYAEKVFFFSLSVWHSCVSAGGFT